MARVAKTSPMALRISAALAAIAALAFVVYGFAGFHGNLLSDEGYYFADALLFLKTGKLLSSTHVDRQILQQGFIHSGYHATGLQVLLAGIFAAFGPSVEAVWRIGTLLTLAGVALYAFRKKKELGAAGALLLVFWIFLYPGIWIWNDFVMCEAILIECALFGLLFWEGAMESASRLSILPFFAACGIAIFVRESEFLLLLPAAALWILHAPAKRNTPMLRRSELWRRAAIFVASALAIAVIFKLLNPVRPVQYNANAEPIQGSFIDGSIFLKVLTGQFGVFEVARNVLGRIAKNLDGFFTTSVDLNDAHLYLRLWVAAIWVTSVVRLRTLGSKAPQALRLGVFAGALSFATVITIYNVNDYRAVRMMNTCMLVCFTGLGLSYLRTFAEKKRLATAAILLALLTFPQTYRDALRYGPDTAFRKLDPNVTKAVDAMISDGAAKKTGEKVLFYDFTGKYTLGVDNSASVLYLLDRKMAELGGPVYHLVYEGWFGAPDSVQVRDQVLAKLSETGMCPTFAVVPSDSVGGLAALTGACGKYHKLLDMIGGHLGGVPRESYFMSWQAPLYGRD